MPELTDLSSIVRRCDELMAHAWMVRTFVKHSEEAEDAPELMELPRMVFDVTRALETRVTDPAAYLKMLDKKLGKLRAATQQFAIDAPKISVHTNFVMAVRSLQICVRELEELLHAGLSLLKSAAGLGQEPRSLGGSGQTAGLLATEDSVTLTGDDPIADVS